MRMKILGISLSTRAAVVVAVALIVCSGTLFIANIATSSVRLQSSATFSDTILTTMPMTSDWFNVTSTDFWATLMAANMTVVPMSRNELNAAQTAVVNAQATAQASLSALPPTTTSGAGAGGGGGGGGGGMNDDSPSDAMPTAMSNPLDQTRAALELQQTRIAIMGTEQALMMTQQAIEATTARSIASNDVPTPISPQSSTIQSTAVSAPNNSPLDINVLLNGVSVLMGAFGVLIGLRALRVESRYRQMVGGDAPAVNKPKRRPSDSSTDDIDTEID